MTDASMPDQAPARRRGDRNRPAVTVAATQLGVHLGLSRQRICVLADVEHVLDRLPDGRFDQDACRLAYLKWLRDPVRRSARTQADADFVKAKAEMLRLRIAEKRRELIPLEEAISTTDEIVGLVLTCMSGMPARVGGHDLQLRRKIEQVVYEVRILIAEAASKLADQRGEPPLEDKA